VPTIYRCGCLNCDWYDVGAADHLLHGHDCDKDDYEQIVAAVSEARKALKKD